MLAVILTTVLALSALYAPQPLLPVLAREFAVSRETAALLITVPFIPLSLAPLFYGYLLESISPRTLLRAVVPLLALSEIAFFFGDSFAVLMGVRFFQGLLIPALLTALMTYISMAREGQALQRAMAGYIAATIFGGFLGRLVSGLIASSFGWRYSFLVLAVSLGGCQLLLNRLAAPPAPPFVRPTPGDIVKVLAEPSFRRLYLLVFCLFLVFAAIMNFIPFRLTDIHPQANEFRIGLMYSGYAMGILTSLNALRLARWCGNEVRAMRLGMTGFAATLAAMALPRIEVLFVVMFLFCGAMFTVHATASGVLNRLARARKGIANGLYVSFYYGGGVVGSYLPGFLYRHFGWNTFLLGLIVVALAGLAVLAGQPSLAAWERARAGDH